MSAHTDSSPTMTRNALLEAGLYCFSERGFEGTSLRMIAERAGRHMSLIAHHFGNKEGLYLAVFQDMLEQRAPFQPAGPPGSLRNDPERAATALKSIIRQKIKQMHTAFESGDPKQIAYFRLWMSAVRAPVPELEPLIRERLKPLRLRIAECIRILRPDFPAREVPFWCALVHGQFLVNTMYRRFNELVFGPECYPESVDELADHIADITLRAIGRPEPLSTEHA